MSGPPTMDAVLEDVSAEYARLDGILAELTEDHWISASAAPGWTITDVVVHLAQSEEKVAISLGGRSDAWAERTEPLDAVVAREVSGTGVDGPGALARWRAASTTSLRALAAADPGARYAWAAAPLRPRTLAITRLAEHWAHALDITEGLGLSLPDTDRLAHVAWLGHATLPYALGLAGLDTVAVRCELDAPGGGTWELGPPDAEARITGDGGAFCRVGARRLPAADSGLATNGQWAATALEHLRNYAA